MQHILIFETFQMQLSGREVADGRAGVREIQIMFVTCLMSCNGQRLESAGAVFRNLLRDYSLHYFQDDVVFPEIRYPTFDILASFSHTFQFPIGSQCFHFFSNYFLFSFCFRGGFLTE